MPANGGKRRRPDIAHEGRRKADRHDEGEMVDPDHGMADAGKQPVHEGLRHHAAQRMVGEGGRGGKQQRQGGESDAGRHGRAILYKRNRRAEPTVAFLHCRCSVGAGCVFPGRGPSGNLRPAGLDPARGDGGSMALGVSRHAGRDVDRSRSITRAAPWSCRRPGPWAASRCAAARPARARRPCSGPRRRTRPATGSCWADRACSASAPPTAWWTGARQQGIGLALGREAGFPLWARRSCSTSAARTCAASTARPVGRPARRRRRTSPPAARLASARAAPSARRRGPKWASKGGQGSAVCRSGGLAVGALVAVNALGSVLGEDGRVLAGCRAPEDIPRYPYGAPAAKPVQHRHRLHRHQCPAAEAGSLPRRGPRPYRHRADGLARPHEPRRRRPLHARNRRRRSRPRPYRRTRGLTPWRTPFATPSATPGASPASPPTRGLDAGLDPGFSRLAFPAVQLLLY